MRGQCDSQGSTGDEEPLVREVDASRVRFDIGDEAFALDRGRDLLPGAVRGHVPSGG